MYIWTVKPILDKHDVNNYRFWKQTGISREAAYNIANGTHKSLDSRIIDRLIPYLRDLTGNKQLNIGDIVRWQK